MKILFSIIREDIKGHAREQWVSVLDCFDEQVRHDPETAVDFALHGLKETAVRWLNKHLDERSI